MEPRGFARTLEQNRALPPHPTINFNHGLIYNNMTDLFVNTYWETATALVAVIVPILALYLVFRLVHDLLWK